MAAKREKGMVFLDTDHFFIRERLQRKLIVEKAEGFDGKNEHVYTMVSDFNGLQILGFCSKKTNKFCVSVKVPCFAELKAAGCVEVLQERYGDLMLADPNAPYEPFKGGKLPVFDVSVEVDLNNMPEDIAAEELVDRLSHLGRNLYAAPFELAFKALLEGTTADFKPLMLSYRPAEQVFVIASPHVVQVIYSLSFEDRVDQELARVFTVEFAESGRRVQKAPGINFYPPGRQPDELAGIEHHTDDNFIGYIVFAVSNMHVDKPAKQKRVCDLLVQFRAYLVYHMKATKTDLHTMMRKTYSSLLQVKERCTPTGKIRQIK